MAIEAKTMSVAEAVAQKDALEKMRVGLSEKIRQTENEISFLNGYLFALERGGEKNDN